MPRLSNILSAAVMSFAFGLSAPLAAEQRPVVVELYTSQGCSSCPPADALFDQLNEHDDVIAIAMHVDYWDYIGWKDEFGDPVHADRQRAYAAKAGRRSIYTPEIIVNGQTDIVGAKAMALSMAIADHRSDPVYTTLKTQRSGASLRVQADVPSTSMGPMEIHVLHVKPTHTSKITRGENRGKTIRYTNIAHSLKVAGTWDGKSPLDLTVDGLGSDPVVVLLQQADAGAIISAARVD